MLTNQARGKEGNDLPHLSTSPLPKQKGEGDLVCLAGQAKQNGVMGDFNCEPCQLKTSTFTLCLHKIFLL